jgi:hypothetical protein
MLNHKNDRAVTAEINSSLAKVLVRKLEAQKRSLIRAMKNSIFELEEFVPDTSLGEPHEWVVTAVARLKKSIKKNSPKPTLWE